jgi:predicted mannosyl-3-phosphoglycerate phosphatase (HAD superfamily)
VSRRLREAAATLAVICGQLSAFWKRKRDVLLTIFARTLRAKKLKIIQPKQKKYLYFC